MQVLPQFGISVCIMEGGGRGGGRRGGRGVIHTITHYIAPFEISMNSLKRNDEI